MKKPKTYADYTEEEQCLIDVIYGEDASLNYSQVDMELFASEIDIEYKNAAGNTPLLEIARYFPEHNQVVKALIKRGSDVLAVNNEGKNVLMYMGKDFAIHEDLILIKKLIMSGLDFETEDKEGRNVLMMSYVHDPQTAIIPFLLKEYEKRGYEKLLKNNLFMTEPKYQNLRTDLEMKLIEKTTEPKAYSSSVKKKSL